MAERSENISGKQRFFDREAARWDKGEGEVTEGIRALVKDLGLGAGDIVIEPGCGTGVISELLLEELGARGRVYGVDISEKMLEAAKAKSLVPRAFFHHADAACMPFTNGFADTVVCFRVFPHLDNQAAVLAEFYRVLKKDGLLVIAHPISREKLNELHCNAGGDVARDLLPEEAEMRQLLSDSGFEILTFVDQENRYLIRARKKRSDR
jgi:ubiquinone/menaquinone biosynthesis C-methylase UbiE